MKQRNILIPCLFIMISFMSFGQDKYTSAVINNLKAWGEANTGEETERVRNTFVRIGDAEKTKWIPYYYAAQMYILEGFSTKDMTQVDLLLKEAEKHIDKIRTIEGYSEAEVLILEGLKYTVKIAGDPATYGPKLSAATMKAYEKAKVLEPKNPRAHYLSAEFEMGAAKFFGKPLDEFCVRFKDAKALFDNQELPSPIYPSWGKDRLENLIEECNTNEMKNEDTSGE